MGEEYMDQLAEAPMAEAWQHWEGQTVNAEFRLRQYLGGSEYSAVFLADSCDGDPRTAAIKLVPENSPSAKQQLSSWQRAVTMSHPNLARIFKTDRCQIGGARLLYAVMEYAEENLSQVVSERPLTESEATEMLKPAVDALAYLHARGLVHGRIRPANIMASGDKLKLSSDDLRLAGDPIGDSSAYDPPETTSSPASDTWSLGMTLVEVLSQRLPAWDRSGQGDPEVPETLPPALRDIARHCLRRDPKLRWTAADIANRLNAPVAVRQAQPVRPSDSTARLRYLVPALIFLLALIGFAGWKLLSHSPESDAGPLPAVGKVSAETRREPQQVASAAVAEKKQTAPVKREVSRNTSPVPAPSSPAEAPAASSAEVANNGVIRQVLPDVPKSASDTIWGTVRVAIRVSVDPSGNVTDATIESPGPSKYFARLALQAARKWKFAPMQGAASDWIVRFGFRNDGTKASAAPATF
jgi:TonB family protein